MREYRHHATDATIEALRRLRRPWAGYLVTDAALLIALTDGANVQIRVDGAELEQEFAAFRLSAELIDMPPEQLRPAGGFAAGGNDVVIFRSETWIEEPAGPIVGTPDRQASLQFTGSPLERSPSAAAVCAVDDAVVVASTDATALLVRCGLQPHAVDVTTDPRAIARFLAERQYGSESPDA